MLSTGRGSEYQSRQSMHTLMICGGPLDCQCASAPKVKIAVSVAPVATASHKRAGESITKLICRLSTLLGKEIELEKFEPCRLYDTELTMHLFVRHRDLDRMEEHIEAHARLLSRTNCMRSIY